MANKRSLKRNINFVCSELFSEVVAISYTTDASDEDVKALLTSILVIHDDYVRRVSHVEPGLAPRLFFKDLITNFNKHPVNKSKKRNDIFATYLQDNSL